MTDKPKYAKKLKLKEEKPHHKEAFEIYYMMGEKRGIRALAKEIGKSPSTIQSWYESFDWKERVEIRENQVKRAFDKKIEENNDTLVNIKASYHKILKFLIAEGLKDIQNGKLKIASVRDLLSVIELDMSLLGEEDRKAQAQMNELNNAIRTSIAVFGSQFEYDGNSRIEEGGNDEQDDEPEAQED